MSKHEFHATIRWTGNNGSGTSDYRAYGRSHTISIAGKPDLSGSSSPVFRGDTARHNPEDLLVAALSACHMLSYLHLCAVNGIVVTDYVDQAYGEMATEGNGGHFTRVVLHPRVSISAESDAAKAHDLHHEAHENCFIASSVNFPVEVQPDIE